MACAEFGHFQLLRARLTELGVDAETAMRPFVAPLEAFHASTAPADWLEGLVKAYVGDGIAADFYREISVLLDDQTRELVLEVFADTGHSEFVVAKVRAAIEADPRLGGRLALWGRRLMGEALSQAQRVAAERDASLRCCRVLPVKAAWIWSSWVECSHGSPNSTPNAWQRWVWRLKAYIAPKPTRRASCSPIST